MAPFYSLTLAPFLTLITTGTVDHGENENVGRAKLINDAIRILKDFTDIAPIQLRHDTAGLGPKAHAVAALQDTFGHTIRIASRIAGNEVADRFDLFSGRFAPQYGHDGSPNRVRN